VKKLLSVRSGILLLLIAFGLLIAAFTVLAVRISREVCLVRGYDSLREDLEIIAHNISSNLDAGDPDSFSFIEVAAGIQEGDGNYSYILKDSSDRVLAPAFMVGKELEMADVHMLKDDGSAFLADVWGSRCYVVRYPFPDRPLELLGIYDDQYVFRDIDYTVELFVAVLAVFFLFLLLLAWFWIIPAVEKILERKRRAEQELSVARDLQQKALTKVFPDGDGYQVHALLQPARVVGGDIYRCMTVGNKLFFAVGDVSDKGMAAAYVMFLLSSVIQSHALSNLSLTRLMGEINTLLSDNPDYEMFCTLFLGTVDLETLEFEYCNAGHTRTVVNGMFLDQDPQLIAGIVRDFPYRTQKMQLTRGSRLLLYTDGVTEARNAAGDFFGEKRLLEWMQGRTPDESCERTCRELLDTLTDFRGGAEQNDDMAIMCIKI